MNRITTFAFLAMTSIGIAASPAKRPAADTPLAQEIGKRMTAAERSQRVMKKSPKGAVYLQHEIRATVNAAFADTLAGKGEKRGKVAVGKIAALHPAILRIEARHLSARAWLNGLEMPEAVRQADGSIPRIARRITLILRPRVDALHILAELRALPEFERLSLDVAHTPMANPSDGLIRQQWALPKIGVPDALDVPPRGPIKVAVVDTGADLNHPDFAGKIVFHDGYGGIVGAGGYDDGMAPPDTGKKFDHGTHVAGIIAAKHDAGGIAGVSNHVELMIMNCATWAPIKDEYLTIGAGDAIEDAVDRGARVINCSFSGIDLDVPVLNDGVTEAIDHAFDHYVLVVASAGNDQQDVSSFWGQSAVPFIVSATMQADPVENPEVFAEEWGPNSGSNFGNRVDIAAPGTAILSTVPSWSIENDPNLGSPPPPIVDNGGAKYRPKNGTSMAAPQVSGAAATIMSMNPTLIYDRGTKQLLQRMARDAGPPGKDDQYGWGLLRLRTDFLWTLRSASYFVTNHAYNLDIQNGHYENPYQNLADAITAVPESGTLVLNGGYRSLGNYHYPTPAQPITKKCTLTALPDHPVTIGQP